MFRRLVCKIFGHDLYSTGLRGQVIAQFCCFRCARLFAGHPAYRFFIPWTPEFEEAAARLGWKVEDETDAPTADSQLGAADATSGRTPDDSTRDHQVLGGCSATSRV